MNNQSITYAVSAQDYVVGSTSRPKTGKNHVMKKNKGKHSTSKSSDCSQNSENAKEKMWATYLHINCGHKTCIRKPVMTPKGMGWLWSLRNTGGVQINRNWRPGAIPAYVATVMKRASAGMTYQGDRLYPERAKRTGPHYVPNKYLRLESVNGNRQHNKVGGQHMLHETLDHNEQVHSHFEEEKPFFKLKKKNNDYRIEMNRVKNKSGGTALSGSEDGEPVRIQLGLRNGDTSQSSMEIELMPKMMKM